jgi:glucosamine kinase
LLAALDSSPAPIAFFFLLVGTTYLLGVDGGGTKTELILVDSASGEIVARHNAPGCNPNHLGPDHAREVIKAGLAALLAEAKAGNTGAIAHTHLYVAGSPSFWAEFAATLKDFGRVTTAPDSLPVLELATGGAPGLVMHAGTGSFIAARGFDGMLHYAGGLGWKLGDPGSGFDLARRAIAHALLELQGWATTTELSAALSEHTALKETGAITRLFYQESDANVRLAAFAPRVLALAERGCHPAQSALAASLSEFVIQARLVTTKLFAGEQVSCGLSGAILNHVASRYALRALADNTAWAVDFRPIKDSPIEGVRRLLMRTVAAG